jgi:hypothetical protein
MHNQFEPLNYNEVVSVDTESFGNLDLPNTFKVVQLLTAIKEYIDFQETEEQLFEKGIDCEVLKFGTQGWRKGKVRLTLEFSPEQPDSPV